MSKVDNGLNREPRNRAERRAEAKASACRHRNVKRRRFIDRTTLTCDDCGDVREMRDDEG